jgi:hypothetical protein
MLRRSGEVAALVRSERAVLHVRSGATRWFASSGDRNDDGDRDNWLPRRPGFSGERSFAPRRTSYQPGERYADQMRDREEDDDDLDDDEDGVEDDEDEEAFDEMHDIDFGECSRQRGRGSTLTFFLPQTLSWTEASGCKSRLSPARTTLRCSRERWPRAT